MTQQGTHELQLKLEQDSINRGVERYRRALRSGEDTMPPGMKLLHSAVGPLSASIRASVDEALSGHANRSVGVFKFISQFEPEVVAFITVKVLMSLCSKTYYVQGVARNLAQSLEDSLNHEEIKKQQPQLYSRLLNRLAKKGHAGYRHVILSHYQTRASIARIKWGTAESLRLGMYLIHEAIAATGLFEIITAYEDGKTPHKLAATPKTIEWLATAHSRLEMLSPLLQPMVIKPVAWGPGVQGGYVMPALKAPLLKVRIRAYLEEIGEWKMPTVYRALNALQDTPWAINQAVLSVAKELWDGGGKGAGLPSRDPLPLPPKTFGPEVPSTDEVVRQWKREAAEVYEANINLMGKRVVTHEKLATAERYAEFDRFYFPHHMDWRGRAYPMPAHLQPQGDDLAKGLLQFADGKPLGERGATWLAVHGANSFGADKASFQERVQWVEDHHAEILDSALLPLDGARFWTEAASPWQFLAFCKEWAGYAMVGPTYVSHLPVSWDGSCNGLQNFSAMLRDPVGGAAVGLVPSDTPSDVYSVVAKETQRMLDEMASNGDQRAAFWAGKVERRLTKRNTMTVPYAVSQFGMREQLREEFRAIRKEALDKVTSTVGDALTEARARLAWASSLTNADASLLATANYTAIGRVVVAARAAMDWLKAVAKVAASEGLPLHWVTPSGLPVRQDYRLKEGKRYDFTFSGHRYHLTLSTAGDKLDTRKQSLGVAPNFVHSLDAAHMQRTVCYSLDAGLTHFAMVHDSFGAHAADAEELSYQLRRAFIDQYSGDVLGDFLDQIAAQLPPEVAAKLPPKLLQGSLDMEAIMESDYFFA